MVALVTLAILYLAPVRVVVSDSMAPTYRAGDVLLIGPVPQAIIPGTIVSYHYGDKLITHRVVEVQRENLITKGDNNLEVDQWQVPVSTVVGEPLVRLPCLGYLVQFVQRPVGWVLFVIVPALWIVMDEVKKIYVAMGRSEETHTTE